MKKVFFTVFLAMLILTACNSSKLSFSEIENVPGKVKELIDADLRLQLIEEGARGSYIVFHSQGEIESTLDPQDNIVNIIFNEQNPQAEDRKQNVYYLTMDSKHDTIKVFVNGEETSFDEVTGI